MARFSLDLSVVRKMNTLFSSFLTIALKEISGDMVLVGNYIKGTQYDIRTTVQNGELVSTPSSVPGLAALFRFIIFPKNHK
ncbi:MAG: hypothetical protein ACLU38_05165 [Dysosmobacter sp.]